MKKTCQLSGYARLRLSKWRLKGVNTPLVSHHFNNETFFSTLTHQKLIIIILCSFLFTKCGNGGVKMATNQWLWIQKNCSRYQLFDVICSKSSIMEIFIENEKCTLLWIQKIYIAQNSSELFLLKCTWKWNFGIFEVLQPSKKFLWEFFVHLATDKQSGWTKTSDMGKPTAVRPLTIRLCALAVTLKSEYWRSTVFTELRLFN